MTTEYRVVFAGAVLDGHEAEAVKQTAGQRLKVTPEQLTRLFSGKPVVLKKGLSISAAEQYVAELNRIGMKARVEAIPAAASSTAQKVESLTTPPAPPAENTFPPLSLVTEDAPVKEAQQAPLAAGLANAPTYVVPRNQIEATRQRLEEALAAHDDPALAPTVIVSPAQAAAARQAAQVAADAATAPTLVMPRPAGNATQGAISVTPEGTGHLNSRASTKGKEAERTLIADEDALNAYLAGGADPIGLLDAAGPALQPVPPSPPPLSLPSRQEITVEETFPAITPPPSIPEPPAPPPALPVENKAPSMPPAIPATPAPSDTPPPIPPMRRALPKTLPQEAALLAGKQERELPPRKPGLPLPIKILLAVTALAGFVGLGLLIWILQSN